MTMVAMCHLHNRILVHQDSKCENVLLTTDGCWAKHCNLDFIKEEKQLPGPEHHFLWGSSLCFPRGADVRVQHAEPAGDALYEGNHLQAL